MYIDFNDIKEIQVFLNDYKRLLRKHLLFNKSYSKDEINHRIDIIDIYVRAMGNEIRNISLEDIMTIL